MAQTYRPTSERAKALHGEDVFEAELSVLEERDLLAGGHAVIEPRPYVVVSDNYEAGEQGQTVSLALPVEQEAALIQGGHIERADQPATKKKG
jgi:hypothetical protein